MQRLMKKVAGLLAGWNSRARSCPGFAWWPSTGCAGPARHPGPRCRVRLSRQRWRTRPVPAGPGHRARGVRTRTRGGGSVAVGPHLTLVSVESFEGPAQYRPAARREADVRDFLGFLTDIAQAPDAWDLFAADPVLPSADGSAFYDLVIDELTAVQAASAAPSDPAQRLLPDPGLERLRQPAGRCPPADQIGRARPRAGPGGVGAGAVASRTRPGHRLGRTARLRPGRREPPSRSPISAAAL